MRTKRPIAIHARLRECTGRSLVLLRQRTARAGAAFLHQSAGLRFAMSSDFDAAPPAIDPGEVLFFERLGAALFYGDPDQTRALARRQAEGALILEPERYVRASELVRSAADAGLNEGGVQ